MKKLLLIIVFVVLGSCNYAYAQCVATDTDPCVGVHQSILDRASKALDELKAAKALIITYEKQITLTDAERAAYKSLTTAMQEAFDARGKVVTDQTVIIGLQAKALELYSVLVEKLTTALNKPKSGWQKMLAILTRIGDIAAGIALGSVL